MTGFREGLGLLAGRASAAGKTATSIAAISAKLQKAATQGDLTALSRIREQLRTALASMSNETAALFASWPFSKESEEEYLARDFENELTQYASTQGLVINRNGRDLIAYPFVLRVLPRERAVLIDGKRTSSINPVALVAQLQEMATNRKATQNDRFLESLYRIYRLVVRVDEAPRAVPLSNIYEVLTLLPGTANGYSENAFTRDIFMLDREGPRKTKSGVPFSLPASTATRNRREVYSFVSPEGERVEYFAIQFDREENAGENRLL